ncbi:hypothetical protein [Bacillus anthracis]|uniref:hypothetical protein n=1 Tax=Bacillus anthracis TaxID=1392 RepID=UPI002180C7AC|nr:hypothetical protein [Bacillus anthracis]
MLTTPSYAGAAKAFVSTYKTQIKEKTDMNRILKILCINLPPFLLVCGIFRQYPGWIHTWNRSTDTPV